jgi:hypothetical protein
VKESCIQDTTLCISIIIAFYKASHEHSWLYIWLCIENEEEITVEEEETAPSTENPPAGNCFYFNICGTEPDSPTTQGKPRCICHLLAVLKILITLYDALGDRSCVLNQLLHFLLWNYLPFLDYLFI